MANLGSARAALRRAHSHLDKAAEIRAKADVAAVREERYADVDTMAFIDFGGSLVISEDDTPDRLPTLAEYDAARVPTQD